MTDAPKPSINTLRVHAQMMSLFSVLGIPVSTAVVIDANGVRIQLPVKEKWHDPTFHDSLGFGIDTISLHVRSL